jgi:hypothetical protein
MKTYSYVIREARTQQEFERREIEAISIQQAMSKIEYSLVHRYYAPVDFEIEIKEKVLIPNEPETF